MLSQHNEDKGEQSSALAQEHLQNASVHLQNQNYRAAVNEYTKALQYQQFVDIYLARARAYEHCAMNLSNTPTESKLKVSYNQRAKNDYELVLPPLLLQAQQESGSDHTSYFWFKFHVVSAQLHVLQGNFNAALVDYTRILELSPKNSAYYKDRANINKQLLKIEDYIKDMELAEQYDREKLQFQQTYKAKLSKYLKNQKGDFEDVFLAEAAIEAGKDEIAVHYCDKALSICADDFIALKHRGMANNRLGREEQAQEDIKRIAEIAPSFEFYYSLLEIIILNTESTEEIYEIAKPLLIQAMLLFERENRPHLDKYKDLVLGILNHTNEMNELSSVDIGNDIEAVKEKLVEYCTSCDYHKALLLINQATREHPRNSILYCLKAQVFTELGHHTESRLCISIAIWLEENNEILAEHYYFRNIINLSEGKVADIKDGYNLLIATLGQLPLGHVALKNRLLDDFYVKCLEKANYEFIGKNYSLAADLYHFVNQLKPNQENEAKYFSAVEKMNQPNMSARQSVSNQEDEDDVKIKKNKKSKKNTVVFTPSPVRRKKKSPVHVDLDSPTNNKLSLNQMRSLDEESRNAKNKIEYEKKKKNKKKKSHVHPPRKTMPTIMENPLAMDNYMNDSSGIVEMNDLDLNNDVKPHTTTITGDISIELLPIEQDIFRELNKASTDEFKYESYIVGGSVFDRVREKLLPKSHPCPSIDDSDFVTDIPKDAAAKVLRDYFRGKKITKNGYDQGINVHESKTIEGLLSIHLENIKIDIMCDRKLKPTLLEDANSRDFAPLYVDINGKVKDPTNFGIADLMEARLRTVRLSTKTYQADPIRLLRAIYQSTKRNLTIQALKKIKKLSGLIVEKPSGQVNWWIKKMFSDHHAVENYNKLCQYGLWNTLFPLEHNSAFEKDKAWLLAEMQRINEKDNVSLHRIYACFIISVVAQKRVSGAASSADPIAQVIEESPLFKEAFPSDQMYKVTSILSDAEKSRKEHYTRNFPFFSNAGQDKNTEPSQEKTLNLNKK